ncbi:MAG: transglutaminase-like domain-containing protein, partial [Verrucomicrobiota bacterium]
RTYAPMNDGRRQRCVELRTGHAHWIETDAYGNRVMVFTVETWPPFATKVISIDADLELRDEPASGKKGNLVDYLQPEPAMPFDKAVFKDQSPMKRFAARLRTGGLIHQWVADAVADAGYVKEDRGALYALSEKRGDCTEYSSLFTALCRSRSIPSRRMGGYICNRNMRLTPLRFHNWSEFLEDGSWKLSDPQKRVLDRRYDRYVAMQVLGPEAGISRNRRFAVNSKSILVEMNP